MTLIEIQPHRWGWKVFEAPSVEPVFRRKITQPITRRAAQAFGQARFGFWIRAASSKEPLRLVRRIENCDAVIRVYDEAGNVIETHEHAGGRARQGTDFMYRTEVYKKAWARDIRDD